MNTTKNTIEMDLSANPCLEAKTAFELLMACPDPAALKMADLVEKSKRARSVIITGPTGSGKNIVAKAVHEKGPSSSGPLVRVNCGNLSPHLVDAQFFGHEKGAFTGAVSQQPGYCEAADGGTLFLNEIGEMPIEFQPRLLDVLDDGHFMRVRGTAPVDARFRVIAATNRNLRHMVNEGKFREDLYFRLNVFRIDVPKLASRPKDITYLADRIVRKLGGNAARLATESVDLICAHPWEGNIRELENAVERAFIVADGTNPIPPECFDLGLNAEDLASSIGAERSMDDLVAVLRDKTLGQALVDTEKALIVDAVKRAGDLTSAAKLLGLSYHNIHYRVSKHKLCRGSNGRLNTKRPVFDSP